MSTIDGGRHDLEPGRPGVTVRVAVDRSRCTGSAFCVRIAPELFALGADGLSMVTVAGEVPAELEEAAEEAENACPATAIVVDRAEP